MSSFIRIASKFDVIAEEIRSWCKEWFIDLDGIEKRESQKLEWSFSSIHGIATTMTLTKDALSWGEFHVCSEVGFCRKAEVKEVLTWIESWNERHAKSGSILLQKNGRIQLMITLGLKEMDPERVSAIIEDMADRGREAATTLKTEFNSGPLRWG